MSEQSANKRLFNMSATPADDVQTSLGAGSRCKGTIKFADVQENSDFFRYFQFRGRSWGELQFRVRGEEYPNMIRD